MATGRGCAGWKGTVYERGAEYEGAGVYGRGVGYGRITGEPGIVAWIPMLACRTRILTAALKKRVLQSETNPIHARIHIDTR